MVAAVVGAGCLWAAGCSFDVIGVNTGDPSAPQDPSAPTQSVPNGPDGGTTSQSPPPSTTPPGPDMSLQRIGTPCTADAQCDPGLFCAKTFGVGPGHVDIPGGYCTKDCSMSTCPANSVCGTTAFGKYCMSSCPPDPCRTGYSCCDQGQGQKACEPMMLCPKES